MLNDKLLPAFIDAFFGYGEFHGHLWFVGMEEGGGNSAAEITKRLDAWSQGGRRELEDLVTFLHRIEVTKFIGQAAKLQSTWSKLARIQLAMHGQPGEREFVRSFQAEKLGRHGGANCLLELLPLPSPSTSRWIYADHSRIDFLATRDAYRNHMIPLRTAALRDRIARYQPQAVVFYGRSYLEHWRHVAGCPLREVAGLDLMSGIDDQVSYIVTKHPVAHGVTNDYFVAVGEFLRNQLTSGR